MLVIKKFLQCNELEKNIDMYTLIFFFLSYLRYVTVNLQKSLGRINRLEMCDTYDSSKNGIIRGRKGALEQQPHKMNECL